MRVLCQQSGSVGQQSTVEQHTTSYGPSRFPGSHLPLSLPTFLNSIISFVRHYFQLLAGGYNTLMMRVKVSNMQWMRYYANCGHVHETNMGFFCFLLGRIRSSIKESRQVRKIDQYQKLHLQISHHLSFVVQSSILVSEQREIWFFHTKLSICIFGIDHVNVAWIEALFVSFHTLRERLRLKTQGYCYLIVKKNWFFAFFFFLQIIKM